MSYEADFVNAQVFQDPNTSWSWTWTGFGSDRFYAFNVAPLDANVSRCHIDDFFWSSNNSEPPSNLIANFVVSNGNTNVLQFMVIGIPSV